MRRWRARRLRQPARVAIAVVMALGGACRTLPRAQVPEAPRAFSVEAAVTAPILRIGVLTDGPRASLAADSGVTVWIAVAGERSPQVRMVARATFVASPSSSSENTSPIRLLETGDMVERATLVPSVGTELLSLDGASYRGVFEVRAGEAGSLTVVNLVNLEDYLRGVVPNELSPQAFPQLEALKAQAVAARTYALRNRGQYAAKGYDLCATAACQVYRGRSTEHPLSDRAVEETRGIAASYRGALINSLYTSTCGGHTEDAANVFEGDASPYLRGVACAPEQSAWATLRAGGPSRAVSDEEGLSRQAALLVALGVLEPEMYTPGALKAPAAEAELRAWTSRLLSALHRAGCGSEASSPLTRRGTFLEHLMSSLCWEERAQRLLSPQDPDYLLQVEDRRDLSGPAERLASALFLQEGIISPFPDNTLRVNAALSRADAVVLLARAAERAGTPELMAAEFRAAWGDDVTVKLGETTESLSLHPEIRLFRSLDGSRAAVKELTVAAGDRVSLVQQGGRVVFLEAEQSRLGAAADRSSRYYRWEVRLTPEEVAKAIARYGGVGAVRDVVPQRIGVSGRIVELAVMGSEGDLILRGLRVRWGLGLRENLFVIDRERGPQGAVERFVFTGKGWGHGVGLCQVGAFGLAQSGSTYDQILRHYYSGISLEPAP